MSYFPNTHDVIDASNSSMTPLNTGVTFTGTSFDSTTRPISIISVICFADQASALNGFKLEWSQDNVNWDCSQSTTVLANQCATLSDKVRSKYYRVVFINGSVNQSIFRLQTIQSPTNTSGTVRNLNNLVDDADEAQLTRSVLTGKTSLNPNYVDVLTDVYGNLQTVIGGQAADAFGRIRSASPTSLFDTKFEYDTQPLLFTTSITGSGTVTKTANEASIILSTGGTANNAAAINQTKQFFPYEPGKSQQVLMTGILGLQVSNVRSEIGYFNENNGLFFRMDGYPNGTTSNSVVGASVVQRTNTSGSVVDTVVPQASWNFDKMDGTGPSGITLDFSKAQIFAIDFEWLGVGRVRFGFFLEGSLLVCHQIQNSNNKTSPYMASAVLPCRASIANASSGVIAGTNTMKQICMTVISEGGTDNPNTYQFSVANTGAAFAGITAGSGTRTPLLSIQPKATFNSKIVRGKLLISKFEIGTNDGTHPAYWELIYNPTTLTGSSFVSADNNSLMNYDKSATAIATTAGTSVVVDSGFLFGPAKLNSSVSIQVSNLFPLTNGLSATPDTFSLCVTGMGGTVPIWGTMEWTEIR